MQTNARAFTSRLELNRMESVNIIVKWNGQEYEIDGLSGSDRVSDLKASISKLTKVLPERQKLLGLKYKGKPASDDIQISELKLRPKTKIMMMGSLEETIKNVSEPPVDVSDVINDLDEIEKVVIPPAERDVFLAKVERRVREYNINVVNASRPGKKLLVLDIDYTLFDHRSVAECAAQLMRPFLHEFLTSAYEDYDIAIWSATSMKWIDVKMRELGVSSHPDYKICFYLDHEAMISVHTPHYGIVEVKPLGVIWGKFDCYNKKNTIMFDDVRRNFLMNPQNGLRIRAFRDAHFNQDKDRELPKLAKYLKDIASLSDFLRLNHKHWERYRSHGTGGNPRHCF